MCVLLITRLFWGVGRWARKPVNHTGWVFVVTPTDRSKLVRNQCVIGLLCSVICVVLLLCPFDISVGVGAFVIGLSQISFLSVTTMDCNQEKRETSDDSVLQQNNKSLYTNRKLKTNKGRTHNTTNNFDYTMIFLPT